MNTTKATVVYWINRYKRILQARNRIWDELNKDDVKEEWLTTRLSEHQWAIDEVLRHVLGSDVRYFQVPIDPKTEQHPQAVMAQWVGDIFFRFQENEHMKLNELKAAFNKTEERSLGVLENLTNEDLKRKVEAPWRQKVSYEDLIEHNLDHELSHHGQVYFILTYFRGPPNFKADWSDFTKVK